MKDIGKVYRDSAGAIEVLGVTIADLDTVVTGGGVEGLPTARALAVAGYLVAPLERHEVLGSFAQDAEAR